MIVHRGNRAQVVDGPQLRAEQFVELAMCVLLLGLVLVVFCFLHGTPHRLDQYDLPKDVVLGASGVASALLLLTWPQPIREDRMVFTLVGFLCWGAIAGALQAVNAALVWRTLGTFGAAATVFLLARRTGRLGASHNLYWGAIVTLCVMCGLVLLEAYGGVPFLSSPGRRPGATLGNRNLAARLACLALPLLGTRLFAEVRGGVRCVLLTMISTMAAVIVLSRSRGTFVVSAVLIAFVPLVALFVARENSRRWRVWTLSWLAAVATGVAIAVATPNRLGWGASDFASSARRVAEYQSGTGRGRVIQAVTTWRMILKNPVWGVGPGNWSVVYPHYAPDDDPSVIPAAFYPGPQVPRNDVLSLVAEWGLMGAVTGLALLIALGLRTARLLASDVESARWAGMMALGVSVTAMLLGIFDSVMRVAPTVFLVALLVGVALGEGEAAAGVNDPTDDSSKQYVLRTALFACVVFSFALARGAFQDVRAMRIINSYSSTRDLARAVAAAPNNVEAKGLLSFVLVTLGRCDLAAPHLRKAVQLQPYSKFFSIVSAKCRSPRQSSR